MCFALKVSFSDKKKLYSRFHCFNFLLVQTAVKLRNSKIHKFTKIISFDTSLIIQISFKLFVQIFGKHIIWKIFPKVHGSSYFYRVGKKRPCQMFFSLSKINVLLWHHYQVIYRYENLCCSTSSIYVCFYYIIICIFMYIQIWCIITVFQICCNA